MKKVGLARALSKLGYCSRSRAAELIAAGRVKLNGTLPHDPETPVHIGKDRIEMDSQPVEGSSKIYLALNKPRGVVTTAADEKNRETAYAYLPEGLPWIAPVGRLDKASEGLLLLTNDSEWAARITAPETHLDKTYHVQISAIGDEKVLQSLRNGIRTSDGEFLRLKNVRVLRKGERHSWLEMVLDEGKNRHIRRMLAELGNLPLFVTAHEQRENIEVIIETVERLSEVRIGALIAMEQSITVLEAVESGVAVERFAERVRPGVGV